jgi:type I restriction enzyme R subunit
MKSQGLEAKPEAVPNLKGDDARAAFIKQFKEVQRLQTQLDQYTDLTEQEQQTIEQVLPKEQLKGFRGQYLETAQRLREQRERPRGDTTTSDEVNQLDFEFVLFASALIDYDYIMGLIAGFTGQDPKKQKMSREQLIGLIKSDANILDEREAITEYVRSLEAGKALDETAVREGYQRFKAERDAKEVAQTAQKHGLTSEALQILVDRILQPPMIFNAEQLNDLLAPLDLGWRARAEKELALMADLVPLLKRRAAGREISGLSAYEG